MIGWCENCGAVEVEPKDVHYLGLGLGFMLLPLPVKPDVSEKDCHVYADCPFCGDDVDQWATS